MKGMLISIVILLILVALIVANALFVTSRLGILSMRIDATGADAEQFAVLYKEYQNFERLLLFSLRDDMLLEINNCFGDCISFAEDGGADFEAGKSRLLRNLKEIRRLSGISLDIIF